MAAGRPSFAYDAFVGMGVFQDDDALNGRSPTANPLDDGGDDGGEDGGEDGGDDGGDDGGAEGGAIGGSAQTPHSSR